MSIADIIKDIYRQSKLVEQLLFEEEKKKRDSHTHGVLHELLVGYHLQGGKHMEQHENAEGETSKQAHDRLRKTLSKEEYEDANNKAKHAAEHIRKHLGKKEIKRVHWTSKPGDIERVTGKKASQKEDPSDIYIEHGGNKHTGISLKVTQKKGGKAPVSNPGHGHTDNLLGVNTMRHVEEARKHLHNKHKELRGKSTKEIKAILKSNPKLAESEKEARGHAMKKIAKDYAAAYDKMDKKHLAHHLRHHLMHAKSTGHDHIRVTSSGSKGDYHHDIVNPETEHDHILNDHKHITVHHEGNSVIFKHKGKTFFKHRVKPEGSAGVFGTIKTSGEHP
jgi:hypothetical protein